MIPNAATPLPRPPAQPVAESPAMRDVLLALADVAPTPTTVLILGESGAGKELVARQLHAASARAAGPLVAVHCAAAAPEALEAEIFGPAPDGGPGRLAEAAGGTLLLDEVAELPAGTQARLLRALQERETRGGADGAPRLVATTCADLPAMVRIGRFRSDLYYRLNVFPIAVPPLRDRAEDVVPLARALLAEAALVFGLATPSLGAEAEAALRAHPFPGNVRELRNLVERAVVRCHGAEIRPDHLGLSAPPVDAATVAPAPAAALPADLPLDLGRLERLAIEEALRRVDGNRTHAARLLGIGLRTLRNKLRTWREAGVPCDDPAAARPMPPGPRGPVALAAGLADRAWARRSQLERA